MFLDLPEESPQVGIERLELAPGFLEPRGLVDWETGLWISEHPKGLVLPLQVGRHRLLVSWDGLAMVRLDRPGQVRLQGRTGRMGSVLTVQRTGTDTTIRGFHGDSTVDYLVQEVDGEIRVEGDTGRFRSCYVLQFSPDEVAVAGDHGEFDSHYAIRFQPGKAHLAGSRMGERVDCTLLEEGDRVSLTGAYQGFHADLALKRGPSEWTLQGFHLSEPVHLVIRLVQGGLEFSGNLPPQQGSVNFTIQATEEGFLVQGKSLGYHLNYRLLVSEEAPGS